MKHLALLMTCLVAVLASAETTWNNLEPKNCLNGRKVTAEQLQGKVVLVDTWAQWCGPCRMMMPHTDQLYRKYKGKGFVALGSAVASGYDEKKTKDYLRVAKLQFPVYYNAGIPDAPSGRGIPFLYLVGRDGKVVNTYIGFSEDNLRKIEEDVKTELAKEDPTAKKKTPFGKKPAAKK